VSPWCALPFGVTTGIVWMTFLRPTLLGATFLFFGDSPLFILLRLAGLIPIPSLLLYSTEFLSILSVIELQCDSN